MASFTKEVNPWLAKRPLKRDHRSIVYSWDAIFQFVDNIVYIINYDTISNWFRLKMQIQF